METYYRLNPPDEDPQKLLDPDHQISQPWGGAIYGTCDKCEGSERGAPVLGLALIKGMQRKGLAYESGTIMDPRDGSVYRALMSLSPDGKKLEVRGYLGISLFGRSQVWNRLSDSAMDPPPSTAARPAPRAQKK